MKRLFYMLLVCYAVQGCKSAHYYSTPVNVNTFANAGEVQFSGNLGTSGFLAKGGVSITDNISAHALINTGFGTGGYNSKDYEASAAWSFGKGNTRRISLYSGYGWGTNYDQDSGDVRKDFYGSYNKPFFIFNFGSAHIAKHRLVRFDANMGFKFSYFMYNGHRLNSSNGVYTYDDFSPEHFLIEPYVMTSLGGRYVRFEYGMSFVLKRLQEIGDGARIFPVTFQIGLAFIINRKYGSGE